MHIAFTNAVKRMGELVQLIESTPDTINIVEESCRTCGDNIKASGYCNRFKAEIPAESLHLKGCDNWFWDDIPY